MKCGLAKVDITPPIGTPLGGIRVRMIDDYLTTDLRSRGVHDNLYARALVLKEEDRKLALVSLDLLGVHSDVVSRIRGLVRRQTGIGDVMVACTHTHAGPDTILIHPENLDMDWLHVMERKAAGAVSVAYSKAKEARMGYGRGREDRITVNRRDPEGPIDPEIGVLRIEDKEGDLMAAVVNFATHMMLGRQNVLFSADFPGFLGRFFEGVYGEGVHAIFLNGSCGNINPWDYYHGNPKPSRPKTFREAERFANIIGGEAVKVCERIDTTPEVRLRALSETVGLPMRKPMADLSEAKRLVARKGEIREKHKRIPLSPDDLIKNIAILPGEGPAKEVYDLAFAEEMVRLAESRGPLEAEIQVFSLNDCAIVAIPGELFVEIGLSIKRASPFEQTLIATYANGYVGYIPTPEALRGGVGYEVRPSAVTAKVDLEGGEVIRDSATRLLRRCRGQ
ncbi:MAG: hypothetical protein ACE5Z5_12000 [Candidatus Bathyarchaeia archaeon]